MAFITGSTPVWGYEKSAVKDMLQQAFSSRPVDCGAGAAGTNGRLLEDSHDKPLPALAGSAIVHPNLPCVAITCPPSAAETPLDSDVTTRRAHFELAIVPSKTKGCLSAARLGSGSTSECCRSYRLADSHIQGHRPVSSTRIWLSPRMESPGNAAAAIRNVQAIGLRDSW